MESLLGPLPKRPFFFFFLSPSSYTHLRWNVYLPVVALPFFSPRPARARQPLFSALGSQGSSVHLSSKEETEVLTFPSASRFLPVILKPVSSPDPTFLSLFASFSCGLFQKSSLYLLLPVFSPLDPLGLSPVPRITALIGSD